MPQATSDYFGALDFEDSDIFHFRQGLPGFEEETQFVAVSIPGQEPLLYLQSVRSPRLCLITLPARACLDEYKVELSPEEREQLDLPRETALRPGVEIACQAIVTVDEARAPSANLAAPLVLNLRNRFALQSFQCEQGYSFRHPLVPAAPACSCS